MMLKEFQIAVKDVNHYTVRVGEHNTNYMDPVSIVFDLNLYYQTLLYIDIFRNKLNRVDKNGTSKVFVSWIGSKMDSSLICYQLVSFWNKVREKKSRCNNFIIVRKFTTTTVHYHAPNVIIDTANLFCHSLNTT